MSLSPTIDALTLETPLAFFNARERGKEREVFRHPDIGSFQMMALAPNMILLARQLIRTMFVASR